MSETETLTDNPTVNGVPLKDLPKDMQVLFDEIVTYEKEVIQSLYGAYQRKRTALEEVAKVFEEQLKDLEEELREKIKVRDSKAQILAQQIRIFKGEEESKHICDCDGNCGDACKCKG